MSLSSKKTNIISRFSRHSDWEDRYKELIVLGKNLAELSQDKQIEKFEVKGCQSKVWLVPSYKEGKVFFEASSDAILVKGIVGLLVEVYSGESPSDILADKDDFLKEIGITEHLSMNRTNGLAAMIKQVKMYAFAYKSLQDKGISDANF